MSARDPRCVRRPGGRRPVLAVIPTLVATAALVALAPGSASRAAPPPGCWNIVDSPNGGDCLLYRVAAANEQEVWASGWCGIGTAATTMIQHWDGGQWNMVPSPNVGASGSVLQGIAAVSENDVWAVGNYDWGAANPQTLTVHWNGSEWSVVPSPNDPAVVRGTLLRGVAGVAANDVWAVGYAHPTVTDFRPIIMHWDGAVWTNLTVVAPPGILHDVAARAPDDVWAVGWTRANLTLAMRWNGTEWTTITTPNVGTSTTLLTGIAALADDDVWAVGWNYTETGASRAFTMHWDGTEWSIVPCPDTDNFALYGIAAIAPDDIWAVGETSLRSLAMHWDGAEWVVAPTNDPPGTTESNLWGIDAVSSSQVWSVNYSYDGKAAAPLTHRYTDPCVTAVADVALPGRELLRVSPTPARGPVAITYVVERPGAVRLGIYDPVGRLVRALVDGETESGTRSVVWDGRDRAGRLVASGVYRAGIATDAGSDSRVIVLMQ